MALNKLNETAHKILDVAERFTQTQGFNAFSYKDLQAEVGVKTSTMHYYFPTKQDLATAMAERFIERFLGALDHIDLEKYSGLKKLEMMGDIFVDVAANGKICLCGMLTSDLMSLTDDGLSELRRFYKEVERWIAKAINQAVSEGDIDPSVQAENAAVNLLATLEGSVLIARARKDSGYMQAVLNQAIHSLKK